MPNLNEHILTHTSDGDWCCNDCPFQTNSESNLKYHIDQSHHTSTQSTDNRKTQNNKIQCNFCEKQFTNTNDLIAHRQAVHKTFKPCRNPQACLYKENCIYNHNPVNENKFLCYECGKDFEIFQELMSIGKTTIKWINV